MSSRNRQTHFNIVTGGILALGTFLAGFAYMQHEIRVNAYSCNSNPIVVSYGDTIWDLVQANCSGHLLNAVDDTVRIYGAGIQLGQEIIFPQK